MGNAPPVAGKVTLSTKGQVVIPKEIREAHGWEEGEVLEVVDSPAGVTFRTASPFKRTTVEEVGGCLYRPGRKAVSIEEMNAAAQEYVVEQFHRSDQPADRKGHKRVGR